MEGRFNQDLPESLQAAFKKATNFEPRILTKQSIKTKRMNEFNQIDVTQCDDEFEVNEAHVQNPNYKGKNYNPNYQNRNKNDNNNNSNNGSSNTATINTMTLGATPTTTRTTSRISQPMCN